MKEQFDIDYLHENGNLSPKDINFMKAYFSHEYMHMNEDYLTAATEHFVQITYQISKLQNGNMDPDEVSSIAYCFIDEVEKLYTNDHMYYSIYAKDTYQNKYEIRVPYTFNGSIIDAFLDLHVFDHPVVVYNYGLCTIEDLYEGGYVDYFDDIDHLHNYMDKNNYSSTEEILLNGIMHIQ